MRTISLLILILTISCKPSEFSKEEKSLSLFLKSDEYLSQKKCILLVPAYGCGKCTEDIINYSLKNYRNKNILFIFSDMTNKTDILFKNKADYAQFIKIDKFEELKSQGLLLSKPVAIFIKDKQIDEVIKFDDTSSTSIIYKINEVTD